MYGAGEGNRTLLASLGNALFLDAGCLRDHILLITRILGMLTNRQEKAVTVADPRVLPSRAATGNRAQNSSPSRSARVVQFTENQDNISNAL